MFYQNHFLALMTSLLFFKLVLIEWWPLNLFVSKFDGRSSWRHGFTAFLKVVSSENDDVTTALLKTSYRDFSKITWPYINVDITSLKVNLNLVGVSYRPYCLKSFDHNLSLKVIMPFLINFFTRWRHLYLID